MHEAAEFIRSLKLTDIRSNINKKHALEDTLFIVLVCMASEIQGWDAMFEYASINISWFQLHVPLLNGIPSADTIRRVAKNIYTSELEGFASIVAERYDLPPKAIVSVDGKTIRNKREKEPLHIVSAFAGGSEGVILDQMAVASKSNEIPAVRDLLKRMGTKIKGKTVTMDAMHAQIQTLEDIVEKNQANYVVAIKGNQPTIFNLVKNELEQIMLPENDEIRPSAAKSQEKSKSRPGKRTCQVSHNVAQINAHEGWGHVKTVAITTSENHNGGIETRYFISGEHLDSEAMLRIIREHWQIENCQHYVLDVALSEDGNRINIKNGAENLSLLRKIALNTFRQIKPVNHLGKPLSVVQTVKNLRDCHNFRNVFVHHIANAA